MSEAVELWEKMGHPAGLRQFLEAERVPRVTPRLTQPEYQEFWRKSKLSPYSVSVAFKILQAKTLMLIISK